MKYIVLEVSIGDSPMLRLPIVFPDLLVHSMVADQLTAMLKMQYFKAGRKTSVKVISAGMLPSTIFMDPDGVCNGSSESLGVKSLGKEDDQLLGMLDYGSAMMV